MAHTIIAGANSGRSRRALAGPSFWPHRGPRRNRRGGRQWHWHLLGSPREAIRYSRRHRSLAGDVEVGSGRTCASVQADGARLPLHDSCAAAIVLINAFLFPGEVERVLSPTGALVWVNSSGEQTPIYLSVEDLVTQLPGEWTGTSSRAGEGYWCVLTRA